MTLPQKMSRFPLADGCITNELNYENRTYKLRGHIWALSIELIKPAAEKVKFEFVIYPKGITVILRIHE